MIVAERKPMEEILERLKPYKRVLLAGCRGCVTVCNSGGEKEVSILAAALQLARQERGEPFEPQEITVERQCDAEYLDPIRQKVDEADAVLSTACGAGVQFSAEHLSRSVVLPALNTVFIGVAEQRGIWGERCQACGDCKLDRTGGICPVTRCSKSIMNGPCGGSTDGHCEIDDSVPCGWQLIVDRLDALGEMERYEEILEEPDWSKSRDGGPRRYEREDLK